MKRRMAQKFGDIACTGDYIEREVDGYTLRATLTRDEESSPYDYAGEGHCFDTQCPEYGEYNRAIIKAWERGAWEYVGIVVQAWYNDVLLDAHITSLWGIEMNFPDSDNAHLTEAAEELMSAALDLAKDKRAAMLRALQLNPMC